MKKDEIENGLTSPDLEIRKLFAEDEEVFGALDDFKIERGLNDKSPLIRYIFAKKCFENNKLTYEQVENGLKDKNSSVRALFIKKSKKKLNEDEITFYLQDSSNEVKIALLRFSPDVITTKEQRKAIFDLKNKRVIEALFYDIGVYAEEENGGGFWNTSIENTNVYFKRSNPNYIPRYRMEYGLISQHPSVRNSLLKTLVLHGSLYESIGYINFHQLERCLSDEKRKTREKASFINANFYTKKQIERGLKDDNIKVRLAFVSNINLKLTHEQIIRVFKEDSRVVAKAFSEREDFEFSPFQIELGLTSKYSSIREHFAKSAPILTDEQIKQGLNDTSEQVVAAFINRSDSLKFLDSKKIDDLLASRYSTVRIAVALRKDVVSLTDEQIESMLTDENFSVKRIIAERKDIVLNQTRINRGLNDKDYGVREVFSRRIDFTPNEVQIDQGIRDSYYLVRYNFLQRKDITLTVGQIEYSLTHEDSAMHKKVRGRREYSEYYKKNKNTVNFRKRVNKLNI